MRAPEFWAAGDDLRGRLLAPLGHAFGLLGRLRRSWLARRPAPVPVICVGNLTVGGGGKTPTVMALAGQLGARGHLVHCLTRGYGGRTRGPLRVQPDQHEAAEVGDEALLLAAVAPTWVARDRLAGARAAHAAGAEIVIMDDGLQNAHLEPDLGLVVIDGAFGFGNGRLLPAGPLREPVDAGLARVGGVVLIGADTAGVAPMLPPGLPVLRAVLQPAADAPDLEGQRFLAFAGIARPSKLFDTASEAGALLVARHVFADHRPYRRREIEDLLARADRAGARCLTTAKDWVRLPPDLRPAVTVLPVELLWADPSQVPRLLASLQASRGFTI